MEHTASQLNLPFKQYSHQSARTAGIQQWLNRKNNHTSWWGPLWRGLTVESSAKHYRAMGTAVWLYLYLIVHANRKTGTLFRLVPTVASEMGISVRTIQQWLARLRQAGYIVTTNNGRGLTITVAKWKPLKGK